MVIVRDKAQVGCNDEHKTAKGRWMSNKPKTFFSTKESLLVLN